MKMTYQNLICTCNVQSSQCHVWLSLSLAKSFCNPNHCLVTSTNPAYIPNGRILDFHIFVSGQYAGRNKGGEFVVQNRPLLPVNCCCMMSGYQANFVKTTDWTLAHLSEWLKYCAKTHLMSQYNWFPLKHVHIYFTFCCWAHPHIKIYHYITGTTNIDVC